MNRQFCKGWHSVLGELSLYIFLWFICVYNPLILFTYLFVFFVSNPCLYAFLHFAPSSDAVLSNQNCPVPNQAETDNAEIQSSDGPLALSDADRSAQQPSSTHIEPDISEEDPQGAEEPQLSQEEGNRASKADRRPLWSKGDSCYYSTSYSESGLTPEDEGDVEEGEDNVFQEVIRWYRHCRSISDTSGALSFDEEEDEQEEGSKQWHCALCLVLLSWSLCSIPSVKCLSSLLCIQRQWLCLKAKNAAFTRSIGSWGCSYRVFV